MAMHARWKRASNNTIMVVECDRPIDPDRLRTALDRLLDVCPWPASRLRRAFPWGKLHWAAGPRPGLAPPAVREHVARVSGDVHRELEGELNATIDPRREPPLRLTLVEDRTAAGPVRGILVVTWFHPLMDPRGGQSLLAYLACGRVANECSPADVGSRPEASRRDSRPLRERGLIARRSLEYLRTLAPVPPVSPGRDLGSPGPARFRRETFTAAGTGPGDRRPRDISFRLALVGRAMAELWQRRGFPDVPFLLPISVDLRPPGEPGPMIGNRLAFHFARFRPSQTADMAELTGALRRQMADAVRDGQIDANAVAMEFLHYRPLSTMLRALPWTASGEVFSFNCADLGAFPPALEQFLGARILNAYHVPAVLPRPGIGVFFNRCAGTDNLVVSWIQGAVTDGDVDRVVDVVREGMGWLATP